MDYPDDPQTWTVDDQYLAGESLLIAPVVSGQQEREVYLPEGEWFDFWTRDKANGKQRVKIAVPLDLIPVFVKSGTLLPLAQPTLHTEDPKSFDLTVRVYGKGDRSAALYEDDGSPNATLTTVTLAWDAARQTGTIERSGPTRERSYTVTKWESI